MENFMNHDESDCVLFGVLLLQASDSRGHFTGS